MTLTADQKLEVLKGWEHAFIHVGVDISTLDTGDIDIISMDIVEIAEEMKVWIKGTDHPSWTLGHFTCAAVEGYLYGYFDDPVNGEVE